MAGSNGAGGPVAEDDFQVGDLVVIMAEPGPFTVVDVAGRYVTIASANGVQRKVLDVAVRKVSAEPPVAR